MKKSFIIPMITIVIYIFLLNGCAAKDKVEDYLLPLTGDNSKQNNEQALSDNEGKKNGAKDTNESYAEDYEITEHNVEETDPSTPETDIQNRESLGLTNEQITRAMNTQKDNYAFSVMDHSLQQLYVEIYTILSKQAVDIIVTSVSAADIDYAFQCVMNDHPEIFYVKGYTYTKFSVDGEIRRIAFSGTYTMEADKIASMRTAIEKYVNNCINGMEDTQDDYQKVKYVYEYLVNHTEYNLEAKENQNICSVCVYGESVCQGYAKTMQYILNRLGIPATLVIGMVDTGEGHAWNLVNIDGAYYYVDPTWGDAYYQLEETSEKINSDIPNINYDYLCVTTEQLCTTHVIDNIVPMPRCISMKDNYYVREGAYFETYQRENVQRLFEESYEKGNSYVTLKCASFNVYTEMKKDLITDQTIFSFLRNRADSIAYTSNEDQLTISFWL